MITFIQHLEAQRVAYDAGVNDGVFRSELCCGKIGTCTAGCVPRADFWKDVALCNAKAANTTIVTPDGVAFKHEGGAA